MRRMCYIQKEKYLLQLLAYGNNYKQKVSLLKNVNKIQYLYIMNVLKEITPNILCEVIPLIVQQLINYFVTKSLLDNQEERK